MREPGEIAAAFPRPGRALKAVLALIAVLAVASAIVVHWAPGGERGLALWMFFAFEPRELLHGDGIPHIWTLLTSGVLTFPDGISHALWSVVGLYFLTTDLEKRWGGARMFFVVLPAATFGGGARSTAQRPCVSSAIQISLELTVKVASRAWFMLRLPRW